MAGLTVATVVVLLVILLTSVLPIMVGATLVGAGRAGVFWSFVALLVSAVLHAFGLVVPVVGNLIAFVLAGVGFAWILRTSVLRGLIIHLVQIVFWVVMALLASLVFGAAILGGIAALL